MSTSISPRERVELAESFLRELARGIPDDERLIAGYAPEATVQLDADGKKANSGWWPEPWKDGRPIPYLKNCYVCISSSRQTPNPKTGKMRYWRGDDSAAHGLALMVDDIGHGTGSKGGLTVSDMGRVLAPTAVVETSPNNFQLWYFFSAPDPDMRKFKAFLSGFVDHVLKKGGDRTIKDISRYGRMPVGINNKRLSSEPGANFKYPVDADKPHGEVFTVALRHFTPNVRYTMDEIAAAFHFPIIVPAVRVPDEFDRESYIMDKVWLAMAVDICGAARMGEAGGGVVQMNMSGKYRIKCPWGNEHHNGDEFGAYFRGAIPGAEVEFVFGCGHDTCRKDNRRTWNEFIDALVMPTIYSSLDDANAEFTTGLYRNVKFGSHTK